MTHEEMRDMYEFYTLGLLEPGEQDEIQEHVKDGCDTCRAGIRRAMLVNAAILSLAPDAAPPKRLRKRILASLGIVRQSWGWLASLSALTAGLLMATLWFSTEARRSASELTVARQQVTRTNADLTRVQAVLEFLNQPDTRQVTFGKGQQQPPRGTVLVNPKSGVLLIASNLPPLATGKTYELWLIPKGGAPKPAGLFQSDPQGNAVFVQRDAAGAETSTVAVTVEPEAGSAAPTTTPIIVAAMAGS